MAASYVRVSPHQGEPQTPIFHRARIPIWRKIYFRSSKSSPASPLPSPITPVAHPVALVSSRCRIQFHDFVRGWLCSVDCLTPLLPAVRAISPWRRRRRGRGKSDDRKRNCAGFTFNYSSLQNLHAFTAGRVCPGNLLSITRRPSNDVEIKRSTDKLRRCPSTILRDLLLPPWRSYRSFY